MKDIPLFAVVVLYNTSVSNSITCKNILKISNHHINTIIVDNSTQENNNRELCDEFDFTYISMHGNKGLSKAYNRVLNYLKGQDGIVIWFDDDTNISQEFFDHLCIAAVKHPEVDIFVPVIEGQDGKFWSPNKARFFKNKQLKRVSDEIKNEEFNAINSCTASRLVVFKNYRYDERLFLDQVDHSFCRDQRKLKRKFYKLPCIVHHNFSTRNKRVHLEELQKRYKIMIPDFLTYCNVDIYYRILGYVKVIGWGIRGSIQCKNLVFLLWCINQTRLWRRK
ncbi:glycosyltransferase [Limosilactobacillus reuteri]|uniref:glycosyltransferase n=1 Tax=Limosilactobacillus reuteri TaxID=1598 RepID=UPI001E42F81B|nr:glycosyltransferase [Limosilactobacillus reuteri]MCC4502873.1 glycosyltransferase [Limosilactobacillus reuteri]